MIIRTFYTFFRIWYGFLVSNIGSIMFFYFIYFFVLLHNIEMYCNGTHCPDTKCTLKAIWSFYFFILCLRIALPKRIAELRPKHQSVCCIYKHISLNGEEGNQTFSSNFSHKNRVSEMESQSDSVSFSFDSVSSSKTLRSKVSSMSCSSARFSFMGNIFSSICTFQDV